jgi:hypothetical protein
MDRNFLSVTWLRHDKSRQNLVNRRSHTKPISAIYSHPTTFSHSVNTAFNTISL